jgi:general stress protein 26
MNTDKNELREQAYQLLFTKRAATLATVDEKGMPHSAFVYIVPRKDLSLYFTTSTSGRKFHNIFRQTIVAMSITDEDNMTTIQLRGKTERVDSLKLEQEILYELMTFRYKGSDWSLPALKLFENGATNEVAIIKVTPSEMTYADFAPSGTGRFKSIFQQVL